MSKEGGGLSRSAGCESRARHLQEFAAVGVEGRQEFDTAYYSEIEKSPHLFRRPENLFPPYFIGANRCQGEFIPDFPG